MSRESNTDRDMPDSSADQKVGCPGSVAIVCLHPFTIDVLTEMSMHIKKVVKY